MKRERNPFFLGITYDGRVTFRFHIDKVCKKGRVRVNALQRLSVCDWGWNKNIMKNTYIALVCSVLLYSVSA